MHILVVANNLLPGGAERVIVQLLNNWVTKDIDCSLVIINKTQHYYTLSPRIKLYELESFYHNAIINKFYKYGEVRKIVKKVRPDIVLSLPEEIGIYVTGALLGTKIPVVVSERNNPWIMPNKKVTRILRKLLYPFTAGLIFQTEQAASFFAENIRRKGIVLPNPLDISRLSEVYTGEREKIVVSAGRLESQKNFPLLIRAFFVFHEKHPDYRLIIYGEGGKRNELETLASQILPDGCWSMPGRVKDLPERIGHCMIFALSSDYEGVPNVLIEAMAMGTPAVSTDCAPGGAATLIHSGENGILTPVGDVDALTAGLCYMADNPVEALKMAQKAATVRQEFDAEIVAARWLEYLKKYTKVIC